MSVLFIEVAIKTSFLLATAATANVLLYRRASAASRHLVWTLAFVGLILLPILSAALPSWEIAIRAATAKAPAAASRLQPTEPKMEAANSVGGDTSVPIPATASAPAPSTPIASPIQWVAVLPAVYAAGVLLLLLRLVAERWTVERLARHAPDVSDPEWTALLLECAGRMGVQRPVRLLRSLERTMPMAFGIRVPAILIPSIADTWSEDRRRAVLLHELAHVARRDCLTQLMASVACAIYWIHPGVWWMARHLRVERELACDDRVLGAGTDAPAYARHLLELAYALGGHRAPALAVSMARPRQLEGRMLAVLDAARNRAVPALRSRMAGIMFTAALLVPLAAAQTRVVPPDGNRPPAAYVESPGPASRAVRPAQRAEARPFPQEGLPGTWQIRPSNTAGTVQLELTEGNSHHSASIPIKELEGLSPAMLSGAGGTAQFSMRRDAGTFAFEGTLRSGVGAGTYTFAPSASFPSELAKRGLERPTAAQQYVFARNDIGFPFLDELTAQGYARPNLSELVAAAEHGVHLDYLREMGRLGYRLGVVEALVRQRDHGVSPEYIRELGAYGITGLSPDDILRARDHGVDPEYVRALLALGYQKLALDTLIQLRDHGVDPEYVRDLGTFGYQKLPLDALIQLRDHGVDPDYVRGLAALGYERLPIESLIRLRDHGVTPQYVRALRERGQVRLTVDELIILRDRGLTSDRIRGAIDHIFNNVHAHARAVFKALADLWSQ